MSRSNKRGTTCALPWSNSAVIVFDFRRRSYFCSVVALSIVNNICLSISGDKASAESQVKDLEDALAKQRDESKKALDDAKNSAALREKEYAEHLASLARDVGGESNSPRYVNFFCL